MPDLEEKPIDFSALPRLSPREGSFEAMLARRDRQRNSKKTIPWPRALVNNLGLHRYQLGAAAAVLIAAIGAGLWSTQGPPQPETPNQVVMSSSEQAGNSSAIQRAATDSEVRSAFTETVEWYTELGSGTTSEPLEVADALFESF